jgi:EpsI family protein
MPRATGADQRLLVQFRDAQGRTVDVFVARYARQDERIDATGFGEGALPQDTDWRWLAPAAAPDGMTGDALFAQGSVRRIAWTRWQAGSFATASRSRLKLAVMRDRALLMVEPVTTVIVSAEGTDNAEIATRLNDFAAATGGLPAWMDRATAMR